MLGSWDTIFSESERILSFSHCICRFNSKFMYLSLFAVFGDPSHRMYQPNRSHGSNMYHRYCIVHPYDKSHPWSKFRKRMVLASAPDCKTTASPPTSNLSTFRGLDGSTEGCSSTKYILSGEESSSRNAPIGEALRPIDERRDIYSSAYYRSKSIWAFNYTKDRRYISFRLILIIWWLRFDSARAQYVTALGS